jgi:hypothetical protein
MTETNCDLFTHKSSRSYLNHLVSCSEIYVYDTVAHFKGNKHNELRLAKSV